MRFMHNSSCMKSFKSFNFTFTFTFIFIFTFTFTFISFSLSISLSISIQIEIVFRQCHRLRELSEIVLFKSAGGFKDLYHAHASMCRCCRDASYVTFFKCGLTPSDDGLSIALWAAAKDVPPQLIFNLSIKTRETSADSSELSSEEAF